ncbi:MAG: hypothetical protein NTY80_04450 [candidate division SR1 bacterium]|nr:hypothetical protein [candidate division SR1 bacterium]
MELLKNPSLWTTVLLGIIAFILGFLIIKSINKIESNGHSRLETKIIFAACIMVGMFATGFVILCIITGIILVEWAFIIGCLITIIVKVKYSDGEVFLLTGLGIGIILCWYVGVGMASNQWRLLNINLIILFAGGICGYLYERGKNIRY